MLKVAGVLRCVAWLAAMDSGISKSDAIDQAVEQGRELLAVDDAVEAGAE